MRPCPHVPSSSRRPGADLHRLSTVSWQRCCFAIRLCSAKSRTTAWAADYSAACSLVVYGNCLHDSARLPSLHERDAAALLWSRGPDEQALRASPPSARSCRGVAAKSPRSSPRRSDVACCAGIATSGRRFARQRLSAIASISTFESTTSFACVVERAGFGSGKNSAYTRLKRAKSAVS